MSHFFFPSLVIFSVLSLSLSFFHSDRFPWTCRQFRALIFLAQEKGISIAIFINNLNNISTTTTLGWLPKNIPSKIRVIVTLDSNGPQTGIVEALEEFKHTKYQLEPFTNVTKEDYAKQVLFPLLVMGLAALIYLLFSLPSFFLLFDLAIEVERQGFVDGPARVSGIPQGLFQPAVPQHCAERDRFSQ